MRENALIHITEPDTMWMKDSLTTKEHIKTVLDSWWKAITLVGFRLSPSIGFLRRSFCYLGVEMGGDCNFVRADKGLSSSGRIPLAQRDVGSMPIGQAITILSHLQVQKDDGPTGSKERR